MKRIHYIEAAVFVLVLGIFTFKAFNATDSRALHPDALGPEFKQVAIDAKAEIRSRAAAWPCEKPNVQVKVSGGRICREPVPASLEQRIYDSYSLSGRGRETIYPLEEGAEMHKADLLLRGTYAVDRFKPVTYRSMTWREDPYRDRYWRFKFYGLQEHGHLLYALDKTGDPRYALKLRAQTDSFVRTGMEQPHSWDDYHAVAFRAMTLNATWWKLREHQQLPVDSSTRLLKALKRHGDFLADFNHYQPTYNHGVNQTAALLLLSVSFPDLSGADRWRQLATERLDTSLEQLVDADGTLAENSPFYHAYTLEKYWAIRRFAEEQELALSPSLDRKVEQMIRYATYMLQPDGQVPLLGASQDKKVGARGEYLEMMKADPEFRYVVSHGERGREPRRLNVSLPQAGMTMMRSGWGEGDDFRGQTQVQFDTGDFRTPHSDLDALSFSLFGDGQPLLPDAGLYTYETNAYGTYFNGTAAHNTVVVDGKDQLPGLAKTGKLLEGDGYAMQTGQHSLYPGVNHQRAIMLVDKRYLVVVDRLKSETNHRYEQKFHLFPDAQTTADGLRVAARDGSTERLSIDQIRKEGITERHVANQKDPVAGVCSREYHKLLACPEVTYSQSGKNAQFITAITIGKREPGFSVKASGNSLSVRTPTRSLEVSLGQRPGRPQRIEVTPVTRSKPAPKAAVSLTFDDGYASILPAAEVLRQHGMKANVGVIGKYVRTPWPGYLTLKQLKHLQDDYGWNMVNHTYEHREAVPNYSRTGDYAGFERDVLAGLQFLHDNDLNNTPNWYIYPGGSYDPRIREIVGKYYRFARSGNDGAETYPYASPLEVKSFTYGTRLHPEKSSDEVATLAALTQTIRQAKVNNQEVQLTFHRIESTPSDRDGLPLERFKAIVELLDRENIPVKTYSELDASRGVGQNRVRVQKEIPETLTLDVAGSVSGSESWLGKLWHRLTGWL